MKKIIVGAVLVIIFVNANQIAFGAESNNNDEKVNNSIQEIKPRSTVRYRFKSIPPLKYKGLVRIDYYFAAGVYIGVYL